jgi:POT family proton-dependent oligopeptide transporter
MAQVGRLPRTAERIQHVTGAAPDASSAAPSGIPGPTLLGHPRGLFLLCFVEMWERFSYYGMRALLVLYLVHQTTGENPGRGWSKAEASTLYGWYTGLAYLMPLFGGMIADRLIGTHRSLVAGGVIIALGHAALALSGIGGLAHDELGLAVFVTGLALIVIGTGHFKPSISVMVGQLYPPGDPRRDGAFTLFYMGINLGAFICAFVCGTLGEKVGWHWGFGAAAVGMMAGLAVYLLGRPACLGRVGAPPHDGPDRSPRFIAGAVLAALAAGLLFRCGAFAWLGRTADAALGSGASGLAVTLAVAAAVLAGAVWFVSRQAPADRGPTACILVFIVFNAVFWLAFEQAGSSLNLFAAERTERWIAVPGLGRWEVPATWFQSINPLVIILFGPLFAAGWSWLARRGLDPGQPLKIALALGLVGAGYLVMVGGGLQALGGAKAGMGWLLATYVLHTWGELCISPTGLAFVTRVAPVRSVSFLMGLWFLSNVVANKLGGLMAAQLEGIEAGTTALFWYPWFRLGGQADFFLLFVVSSLGAGLLIALLAPRLDRLLGTRGAPDPQGRAEAARR